MTFGGKQHYVVDPHTAVALGAANVVSQSKYVFGGLLKTNRANTKH